MPTAAEIKQRVAYESDRRARLSVPAAAGGVLFLLSGVILNSALKELPTVGIVQGLEPALRGEVTPVISPRAPEVRFIDHHAFGLVAGTVLSTVAVLALTMVLLFIRDSTRFRRPETWPPGRALALTVGMIAVMVGSLRAGLLPRWLSMLGILAALLFLPLFGSGLVPTLIPTFWLAATGFLFWERLPGGDPPAWAAGEARPWPKQSGRAKGDGTQGQGTNGGGTSGGGTKGGGTKGGASAGFAQRLMGARNGGEPPADATPPPTPVGGSP